MVAEIKPRLPLGIEPTVDHGALKSGKLFTSGGFSDVDLVCKSPCARKIRITTELFQKEGCDT